MSLYDKEVVEDKEEQRAFSLVLEKYKAVVIVNSIDVDPEDDCLLIIDYDHSIDAPADEVADELSKVLLLRLEEGVKGLDTAGVVVKREDKEE